MSETEEDRVLEYFENNKGKVRSAFSITYHTGIPEKRLVKILEKLTKEGNISVIPGSLADGARKVRAWTFKSPGRPKGATKETGKKPTKELKQMLKRQKRKVFKRGEGQKRVREALADGGVKSLEEIAVATGTARGSLHYYLAELIRNGEVARRSYGKYQKVVRGEPVEKPEPKEEEEPPAPEEPEAEEAPPEEEAVDTRTIKERVLDLMEDGKVRTPTQISKETDTGYSRVGRRLTDLVRSEKLSKVGHARYKKYEAPPPVPAVSLSLNLNLNINAEYKSLEAFERGMNCLAMGARYMREVETP